MRQNNTNAHVVRYNRHQRALYEAREYDNIN